MRDDEFLLVEKWLVNYIERHEEDLKTTLFHTEIYYTFHEDIFDEDIKRIEERRGNRFRIYAYLHLITNAPHVFENWLKKDVEMALRGYFFTGKAYIFKNALYSHYTRHKLFLDFSKAYKPRIVVLNNTSWKFFVQKSTNPENFLTKVFVLGIFLLSTFCSNHLLCNCTQAYIIRVRWASDNIIPRLP